MTLGPIPWKLKADADAAEGNHGILCVAPSAFPGGPGRLEAANKIFMKHRRIGAVVGIAFALLIVILSGAEWLGLRRMAEINEEMTILVNKPWAQAQLARDALRISNLNNRITMQIFLLKDSTEIASLLARRTENSKRISALVTQLESKVDSEEERQLLERVKQARTLYVESYKNNTRILLEEKRPDLATKAIIEVTLPLLLEYHAAWSDFIDFQGKQMDAAAKHSAAEYTSTRKLVWLLTGLSMILAVTIAVFTTRHIMAETEKREWAEMETWRLNEELEQKVIERTAALANANSDLLRARDALRFEAAHDPLTSLWNHGAILDSLKKELDRQKRTGEPLGVIMADLDCFKKINDVYGHLVGDTVLQQVAQRFQKAVRSYDSLGRYGGEEFLILVPSCDVPDLIATAERLRRCIADKPIPTSAGDVSMTVSMGLVSTAQEECAWQDCETLLRAADAALYVAKAEGRNRVVISPASMAESRR
jgi:diguanylate cyclase (GGDEF)-like protein